MDKTSKVKADRNGTNKEQFEYTAQLLTDAARSVTWAIPDHVPNEKQIREWLAACTTTRGGFRFITRPRKNPSLDESTLFERLRWHKVIAGGSYCLDGYFNSYCRSGEARTMQMDTFATILSILMGNYRNSADVAWARQFKNQ